MPSNKSKISFDAINIVKAENIYLRQSKTDRTGKEKPTDKILSEKKKVVQISLTPNKFKPRNNHSANTTAPKSKKPQLEVTHSKPNSQYLNSPKTLNLMNSPKTVLNDVSISQSSCYLTPRQNIFDLENSNPNEHFNECELDEFLRTQYPDFDDSFEYNLDDPLIFENFDLPPDACRPENSLRHFKKLLDQEESSKNKLLQKNELDLLKDIIKADEQYQNLKKDDYLVMKEILLEQLQEISQQERVIKLTLEKIQYRRGNRVEVDSLKVAKAEQPLENDDIKKPKLVSGGGAHRQEVDIFFKNVPSLEREIRILKLLGLKLEETLKKSTKKKSAPVIFFTVEKIHFKHSICAPPSSEVIPFAPKSVTGLIQEFKITYQTIDELKLERDFYITTDLENFTLQRTNFDMLRQNPELLLQKLKPFTKDSRVKFNIIEQNPMFFDHFLANICKISSKKSFDPHRVIIPKNFNSQESNQNETMAMCGVGDYFDNKLVKEENDEIIEKSKAALVRRKKRKQSRVPMEESNYISPKNNLFKIILLSTLYFTIILLVLSAISYPEAICI